MAAELTKTQIDRLGERLKKGDIDEADLRLLDLYRRSFIEAYDIVVGTIRNELALEPTGRPSKTTTSITDKLRRESIRLTQIQDIAGCRLIVTDIMTQNTAVQSLTGLFEQTTVIDRRAQPSHGYRAVHVVVRCEGKAVEIQVRTSLQHLWAELSEKFSDIADPTIKYGKGDEAIQKHLMKLSLLIAAQELSEKDLADVLARLSSKGVLMGEVEQIMIDVQGHVSSIRQHIDKFLRSAIDGPNKQEG